MKISQFLDVPSTDPNDRRRSRLLNILLLGLAALALLILLATTVVDLTMQQRLTHLYLGSLAMLISLAVIYLINRYGPGWLAGSLFLGLFTLILAVMDTPKEVTSGRSVFMFAIPILIASVVLRPYASFIMAGVVSLVLVAIETFVLRVMPGVPTMMGFFALALVAWLSSRTLERALEDLRILNVELEQRVADRTRDLAEALGKNQAILESIADGVIVFDNNSKAVVTNPAISALLDRPADEIVGRDIEALLTGNVNETDKEVITELLEDTVRRRPTLKLQWGHKVLSVSLAPVRTAPGQVTGTVAVFRDFTREAEIDRMKSAIVSMVSHDLRTPLSAIMGYAEMLQESVYGPLSEKQRTTMERITANAKRLLSLVNDLLDQAQIEAGRLALKITAFSPAELVDGVQSIMGVLAQNKGLELATSIAEDVPTSLQGDPQRLHQILVNLIGNSLKFTERGSVRLRIYRPDETRWAMEVSDTGSGIPPDKLDKVFDKFYQVGDVATRKHSGVGLGLSIVKELAALMGGQVSVTSEVGQGSTFTVWLPLVPPQIQEGAT